MSCVAHYKSIWVLDFEFIARDGECPEVVCMVAYEILSKQWIFLWQEDFDESPFSIGDDVLFIAYSAAAEWSCFLALGWPMPSRCIDLFFEVILQKNGTADFKLYPSLMYVASELSINTSGVDFKNSMRDLIITGGPWSKSEKENILHYCAEDVRITTAVFQKIGPLFCDNNQTLAQSLFRGRYSQAVARIEKTGIPVDINTYQILCKYWEAIKLKLIEVIDKNYEVYDGTRFVAARFANWVNSHNIPWPRTPSSQLKLDEDTFRRQAKKYPQVAALRELRYSLSKLRLNSLPIGKDSRNRTSLMPFGSRTGRNQPSNSKFLFGTSRWIRSLIKPQPDTFIAYIDWVSQEIAIAAALSGDSNLWHAYRSGDPYLGFAIQAGLAPEDATKATHNEIRKRIKEVVLGVNYGMGPESIALSAGIHIDEARELLLHHKLTYRTFWQWVENIQNAGLMGAVLQTRFGFSWKAGRGTNPNPRALLNWPMQANGAEMMRLACCILTENGVEVCCSVHDALLIEGPIKDQDEIISMARKVMEDASEQVLGSGYVVQTDADVVNYPDRFQDEAGIEMWGRVMETLESIRLEA